MVRQWCAVKSPAAYCYRFLRCILSPRGVLSQECYPSGTRFAVTGPRTVCYDMSLLWSALKCPPAVWCHMSARGMLSHVSPRRAAPAVRWHMISLRSAAYCHNSTHAVLSHVTPAVCCQMAFRSVLSHVCPRRAVTRFPAAVA